MNGDILIDGVYGNGFGGNTYPSGNDGISIINNPASTTGTIEIKNCNLQNLGPNVIPTDLVGDTYALYVSTKTGGNIFIHDNVIHDINADAIQIRSTYGDCMTYIYDNEWYDCGENAVDIKQAHNVHVYNNNFYRNPDFTGHGGIGGLGYPLISMIENIEIGAVPGESSYNKIYENYLHDNAGGQAVYIGFTVTGDGCFENEIYGNFIEDVANPIFVGTSGINTKVYGNLIVNSATAAYSENNNQQGNSFFNNTIFNSAGMGRVISLDFSNSLIRDNVFYQTDSSDLILYKSGGSPTVLGNTYYNVASGDQNIITWTGTTYTEAQQSTWQNAGHLGDLFANPQFVSTSNILGSDGIIFTADDGLKLQTDSPACGKGAYSCLSSTSSQNFLPNQNVEAEDGVITPSMAIRTDSLASGGEYVSTNTGNSGSVSFTFDISEAGDYLIEARTIAPTGGDDSFFVGLDSEDVQNVNEYVWDVFQSTNWVWKNVSRRGSGTFDNNEFNPIVWTLSSGEHTFTFYGRETGTLLDRIVLKKVDSGSSTSNCGNADTNTDKSISISELLSYISSWKSGSVTISELLTAINEWKNGC